MYALRAGGFGGGAVLLLTLMLAALPASAQTPTSAQPDAIAELDALVQEHNQDLRSIQWREKAAGEAARVEEERWPQPRLEYMADWMAPGWGLASLGHTLQVMQEVPLPGARERLGAPARAEAEVQNATLNQRRCELFRDLRLDVLELLRLDARMALLQEEADLMMDAMGVIEAVLPLGRSTHADHLQLEIALERAMDERDILQARRREREAALATRVGVETQQIQAIALSPGLLNAWEVDLPGEEQLVAWAIEAEPELQRLLAEEAVAMAQVTLVDERKRPWPQLMAGYRNAPAQGDMQDGRSQGVQLGVSLPIPLFQAQYGAQSSRWQAQAQAIAQRRAQREREVRGQVQTLLIQWQSDRDRLRRYEEELIPLASDLARDFLIAVELGDRTASDYLLATRQEVELEAGSVELLVSLVAVMVELQRLTGGRVGAETSWAYPSKQFSGNQGAGQ